MVIENINPCSYGVVSREYVKLIVLQTLTMNFCHFSFTPCEIYIQLLNKKPLSVLAQFSFYLPK